MGKLSFEIFCIENYADQTNLKSFEVYELFKKEGLLELLRSDYEDLHGMGMEYMVNFCRDYLGDNKV